MMGYFELTKRDMKLFFKDKGYFISSLITPIILLVLYATFLARVYKDSFLSALPAGFSIDEALIDATVGGQLASSLLAVSCVTVAFCANLLMISDKTTGAIGDITVTPVKRSIVALGYFSAAAVSTLTVSFTALGACLLYLAKVGWYMSLLDVVSVGVDVLLLTLFGTALSSCVNFFLKTTGQASAVGTVVSAGYGFICGAYMPISNFSEGLQRVLGFLPGTYGTSLLKSHALRGVFDEMENVGFPAEVIAGIRESIDCDFSFFDRAVTDGAKFAVLSGSVAVFILLYVALNMIFKKQNTK